MARTVVTCEPHHAIGPFGVGVREIIHSLPGESGGVTAIGMRKIAVEFGVGTGTVQQITQEMGREFGPQGESVRATRNPK